MVFYSRSPVLSSPAKRFIDFPSLPLLRTAQKYPSTLSLEYSFEIANKCINDCNLHENKGCQAPLNPPLPSRVLDLGDPTASSQVKLYVTSGELGQYNCLSYCWGKNNDGIKTNKDNLSSHTKGIPLINLPRTFQDALALTKALKICYLWIDALCILQDEDQESKQDWEVEAANMASIYSNSYLTIMATAGSNPEKGLFFQRLTKAKYPIDILHEDQILPIEKINVFVRCTLRPLFGLVSP